MSDSRPVVIRLEDVTKTFARAQGQVLLRDRLLSLIRHRGQERFVALRGVSFTVHAGQAVGLIGHNGAGKSTILALIAGLARPDSGKVEVRGRIAPMLELGAGFHPDLSGLENINLNAALLGLSREQTKALIPEMIEFSGVADFIHAPIRTYSAGMMMRLAFSVAACVSPDIVLIDEVLAVGDAEFGQRCAARLDLFRKQGRTMVIVSHSMDAIRELCDTAVWTDHGRVRMAGPADEVVSAYEQLLSSTP